MSTRSGTNFYWAVATEETATIRLTNGTKFEFEVSVPDEDPRIHIGKRRHAVPIDLLEWAQDSKRVMQICMERSEEQIIRDQDGTLYTGAEFIEIVERIAGEDQVVSIGKRFK